MAARSDTASSLTLRQGFPGFGGLAEIWKNEAERDWIINGPPGFGDPLVENNKTFVTKAILNGTAGVQNTLQMLGEVGIVVSTLILAMIVPMLMQEGEVYEVWDGTTVRLYWYVSCFCLVITFLAFFLSWTVTFQASIVRSSRVFVNWYPPPRPSPSFHHIHSPPHSSPRLHLAYSEETNACITKTKKG